MQKFGFVFPGQGSQKMGMLADLAERYPLIKDTFDEASYMTGYDLWQVVQTNYSKSLDQTQISQPVLLAAAVAIWRVWLDQGGPKPSILAGHSLGEYSALVCAGVLSFRDAFFVVQNRATYMQESVADGDGLMAAILGLDDARIAQICAEVANDEIVSPANYNSPGQTVIAGNTKAVERAIAQCKAAGAKRALPLNVSVPSHCALMKPAAKQIVDVLEAVDFMPALIPVVQNVNAKIAFDADEIKRNLIQQLYMPVLWVDSVNLIHSNGINTLVECGPGKVLGGLIKRIQPDIRCLGSDDCQSLDQALAEVGN